MPATKARPNANPILARMRDDFGSDDWGTAIGWAFGVCEVLHFRTGLSVPDETGFRPSPVVSDLDTDSYPDCYVLEMLEGGEVSPAELQTAARCLSRYLGWLRDAGKAY